MPVEPRPLAVDGRLAREPRSTGLLGAEVVTAARADEGRSISMHSSAVGDRGRSTEPEPSE
jgi:hypothetical protein